MTRRAAAAAAFALAACQPALHATPSPATTGAPPPGATVPAATLAEARAAFARRPDRSAVQRAEALFLQASRAEATAVEGLYGAILAKAWLIEHEPDGDARAALAVSAVEAGQWCLERAPDDARCHYGIALGLGIQARERHRTAKEGLKLMVEHLRLAEAADPALDDAGPARILSMVLVRAPAWPLGPGDPEAAVVEAQRAVATAPDFPPNQLALAEALQATGDREGARAAASRGLTLARARAASGDPDAIDWVRDGQAFLVRKDGRSRAAAAVDGG